LDKYIKRNNIIAIRRRKETVAQAQDRIAAEVKAPTKEEQLRQELADTKTDNAEYKRQLNIGDELDIKLQKELAAAKQELAKLQVRFDRAGNECEQFKLDAHQAREQITRSCQWVKLDWKALPKIGYVLILRRDFFKTKWLVDLCDAKNLHYGGQQGWEYYAWFNPPASEPQQSECKNRFQAWIKDVPHHPEEEVIWNAAWQAARNSRKEGK